jgi:hypothetical protein
VTSEGLALMVVANAVLELTGLALLGLAVVQSRRNLHRLLESVAGLADQERQRKLSPQAWEVLNSLATFQRKCGRMGTERSTTLIASA